MWVHRLSNCFVQYITFWTKKKVSLKWYISKHNSCHWFSVKFVYVRPQGRLPCGAFREQRKYPTGTRKYPLSAWDLTEHTSHRVQLVLWQGRQKRSWKDLKISIFICWDTHSPVICSPMVQELLGHADVSTTMNIYAHSTREAKRTSARLLDKVVGGE